MQELTDLRTSILEGRYEDALDLVNELQDMSKQAILRNIDSFLVRLLVHLIKNKLEKRLTNSWISSISDSVRQIRKLNFKDNRKSYYIKSHEWRPYLEEALSAAILPASVEVFAGELKPSEVAAEVELHQEEILNFAEKLLHLTYHHSTQELPKIVLSQLGQLPGGETLE